MNSSHLIVAVMLLCGIALSGSRLSGEEKKGVSIALTLAPATPESVPTPEPVNSEGVAIKPTIDKAAASNAKLKDQAVTTAAAPGGDSPFPFTAFERAATGSSNQKPTAGAKASTEPTTGNPALGQLMLIEPKQPALENSAPDDTSSRERIESKIGNSKTDAGRIETSDSQSQVSKKSTSVDSTAKKTENGPLLATEKAAITAKPSSSDIKATRKRTEFDNEDATDEGNSRETEVKSPLSASSEDLPLEQEDHPYDAPAADSAQNKPDRPSLTAPAQKFTQEQLRVRDDINRCLSYFMERPETIVKRSPWAVMHAILPFGVEAELGAGSRRVNAIGWMCYNGVCKTQRIFQPTRTGFRTNLGPGVQGHEGQFLAILAQSKVAPTYPIKIGSRNYTINDLVRLEMATCREKSELTFKLIGLSYYLDHNQRWRDSSGTVWSIEKLVAEELDQPIVGAACGGTHRLMGLTFSLLQHKQAGLAVSGHWYRAEEYINDFVPYALSLQNPDGSFGTEWFEKRADEPNVERKVQTTGHTLEWLVFTLPGDQLQSPQILKAVQFLLDSLGAEPGRDWPIGPRGHSLRALALYNQRVFGAQPGKMRQFIANSKSESWVR